MFFARSISPEVSQGTESKIRPLVTRLSYLLASYSGIPMPTSAPARLPTAPPTPTPASAATIGPAAMNGPTPGIASEPIPTSHPSTPPTTAPGPAPAVAPSGDRAISNLRTSLLRSHTSQYARCRELDCKISADRSREHTDRLAVISLYEFWLGWTYEDSGRSRSAHLQP